MPTGTVKRTEQQATRFIQTYARPPAKAKVTAKAWWTAVRPYLTATAAKDLKTDPKKVPFTKQTTEPKVTRGKKETELVATVGTDKGRWVVTFASTTDERLLVTSLDQKKPTKDAPSSSSKPSSTAAKK